MGNLHAVYLFGSVARSERDSRSDLDLLAVVADNEGKVDEDDVLKYVPPDFAALEKSISWYGRRRLAEMFENGELFAWHLHQEAIPLFEVDPVIAALGEPGPYRDGAVDIASFQTVLAGIPTQLIASPNNAIYELGLIYVCLRNICMAASSTLKGKPDFSRYSPFHLIDFAPIPIKAEEYDLAMSCRMAGQRGLVPPARVERSLVEDIHARLTPWIDELRQRLEEQR